MCAVDKSGCSVYACPVYWPQWDCLFRDMFSQATDVVGKITN